MSNLLSGAVQIAILRSPLRLAAVLVRFGETVKSSQPRRPGVDPSNMGHGKLVPAFKMDCREILNSSQIAGAAPASLLPAQRKSQSSRGQQWSERELA
jgi:hypothetical protein